jgi:hypothetical protein
MILWFVFDCSVFPIIKKIGIFVFGEHFFLLIICIVIFIQMFFAAIWWVHYIYKYSAKKHDTLNHRLLLILFNIYYAPLYFFRAKRKKIIPCIIGTYDCDICSTQKKYLLCRRKYLAPVFFAPVIFLGNIPISARQIISFFNIKKTANVCKCETCGLVKVECPHCKYIMSNEEGIKERCPKCSKKFYCWR